jgi:hypothetical protein
MIHTWSVARDCTWRGAGSSNGSSARVVAGRSTRRRAGSGTGCGHKGCNNKKQVRNDDDVQALRVVWNSSMIHTLLSMNAKHQSEKDNQLDVTGCSAFHHHYVARKERQR